MVPGTRKYGKIIEKMKTIMAKFAIFYLPVSKAISTWLKLFVPQFTNLNLMAHIKISHFLPHKIVQGCGIGHLIPIYM